MTAAGRKDRLPLRPGAGNERPRFADPRLGMEMAPPGLVRALAARCPVLLGGDYPLALVGLRALLATDATLRVAGGGPGTIAALREAAVLRGLLVLASARWTGAHAEALATLRGRAPGLRVVLLTDETDEARLHQFRLGGGRAVLPLGAQVEEVLAAIQAARPALAADWAAPEAGLSERETLVLRRKVNGHSNKAIAADLGISVKTVETYYARGMEKLGLKGRVEMLQYGVAQGWISGAP